MEIISKKEWCTCLADDKPEIKVTVAESTNLFNLEKYTNYSISVLAFTSAGDGVVSNPVYCRTLQDGKTIYCKA